MAQVRATTPDSSGTRTIRRVLCSAEVWLMLQWHPVPRLGPSSTTPPAKGNGDILGRGGQQCGKPRRNSVFLIVSLVTRKRLLLVPGKSHHPWVITQKHCVWRHLPHHYLAGNSVLVCKEPGTLIFFLTCFAVFKRTRTSEAYSGWEHLYEHPLLPAP